MSTIDRMVRIYRAAARERRAEIFRSAVHLGSSDRVLDLGGDDGSDFHAIGVAARVTLADLRPEAVNRGAANYGYDPVVIEPGPLPFGDGEFDLVYCSSVIEHVNGCEGDEYWRLSTAEFERRAREAQAAFAKEIRRVGRGYFVQTPARSFPLESHTWLPGVGWLTHSGQARVIASSNRFWVKKSAPNFLLLSAKEMLELFPDATLHYERSGGLVKSIIAVRA